MALALPVALAPVTAAAADALTHVGSRRQLAAGTRPLDHDTLAAWIADPQQWKPGARMPSYGDRLDDGSLRALAVYLAGLE